MSYTPTTWQTGDTITAERLNNMESGILNADTPLNVDKVLPITISFDAQTGVITTTQDITYTQAENLYLGSWALVFLYNGERLCARPVAMGNLAFIFEAELPNYVDATVRKFYAVFLPPVDSQTQASITFMWADEPFIVTLTPTAQDYSGTMDKTVAEIDAAYRMGRKIVFRVIASPMVYMDVDCTSRLNDGSPFPSFNASFITDSPLDAFVYIYTGGSDDGTKTSYNTIIYPLTPMS